MTEPQAPPSVQTVAHEFVKQYYTMLNAAPNYLHRFYSHNSSFIHGQDQFAATGQAEIHKKIMSLNFIDCHARICQVDSQPSVSGSVVIQVIGELSNAGQPMRRFVQSFVLAPQTANKYYVHVDIFRYQDENVSTPDVEEEEEKCEEVLENGKPDQPVLNEEVVTMPLTDDSTSSREVVQLQEPVENGDEASESVVNTGPDTLTNANNEIVDGETKGPAALQETEPKEDTSPSASVSQGKAPAANEADEVTEPAPVEQTVVVPTKPLTWAAMASRKAGGTSQTSGISISTPTPVRQPATGSDQKPEQTPLPQRARPVPASDERSGGSNGRVVVNGSKDADTGSKRAVGSTPVVYNDNQQVFVGNLPQHLTDQELIDFFARFGKVLEFRINRKFVGNQGGNNLGQKNFGFMIFENPETVEKVLAARPIHMNKHRLNVEEKKPREELAAARSRPTRFPASAAGKANAAESGGNFVRPVANGPGPRRNREYRSDARSTSSDEGRTN